MFCRFFSTLLLLFSASHLIPDVAFARSANFIQQRALGPIKLQSGLPEAASRLTTSDELQVSYVRNNVFMGGRSQSERLILDGESSQLNLRYRRQLTPCWQMNLSGVWLDHSRGLFDRSLDDWHQFFGLPDAQRGDWPENQLEYVYENGDESRVLVTESSGLGDIQVQLQRNVGCLPNSSIVRFGVKLPTGEPSKFNGTGSTDAFVDVQSPWQQSQRFERIQWAGSIGLLGSGKHEQAVKQEPVVGFGAAALNIRLGTRTHLLSQLDWHTAMYKSGLRELGEPGVQLSLGLRYDTGKNGVWEFSFSEDAVIDTVPDIVVRLAWVSGFGSR